MGILKNAIEDTKKVVINDANGVPMVGDDGKDVVVEIYALGTKQYARNESKKNARIMNLAKQQAKIQANPEAEVLENARFMADLVKTAPTNINQDFPDIEGRELIIALLIAPGMGFVFDQLNREYTSWSNFTKPSATT